MKSSIRGRQKKKLNNQKEVVETWKKITRKRNRAPIYVSAGKTKKSQQERAVCVDLDETVYESDTLASSE